MEQNYQNNSSRNVSQHIRLHNIGNTCYLNSALQCLLNNKFLINEISRLANSNTNDNTGSSILNNYDKIRNLLNSILELVNSKGRATTPKRLKKVLSEYNDMYRYNQQQDCHECLMSILDIIHEQTKGIQFYQPEYMYEVDKKTIESNKQWKSFNKIFGYSLITHIFNGQFISTTHCSECGNKNHSFESFNNISLNIPKDSQTTPSIRECFYNYFKPEILDVKIECDHCPLNHDSTKKRTTMKKNIYIWRFPRILIVSLKRWGDFGQGASRDDSNVELNYILQFNIESTKSGNTSLIYDLKQIVNHEGRSPYGGHYNTIVIDDNNRSTLIDDETVIPFGNKRMGLSKTAYILVYVLRT